MTNITKQNQSNTPLWTAIKAVRDSGMIFYDVPGHKRNPNTDVAKNFGRELIRLDANSSKPLDNMVNPIGVIKDAELLMAEALGADYAFFLVNGTTQGVQSMIMSICNPGDKIIIPRNVHKSVISALILGGAIPIYMQPEIDSDLCIALGVTVEVAKQAILSNPDAKAILIINPTYYGVASDISKIVKIAHEHNIAVLADEAHGAHFPFNHQFPIPAMKAGADLSAASLHKTCGSLTQSSVLLVKEHFVTKEKVKTILNLAQTTSASYLLMGSLDVARKNLVENGETTFDRVIEIAEYGRREISQIEGLKVFSSESIGKPGVFNWDKTKLIIKVSGLGLSGLHVYDILRDDYNIQLEFGDTHCILAVLAIGDTFEMMDALISALQEISKKYKTDQTIFSILDLQNPEVIVSPRDAFYHHKTSVSLDEAIGKICGENVMAYPPGIPIVSPGERITGKMIEYIKFLKNEKSMLSGTEDAHINRIKILDI